MKRAMTAAVVLGAAVLVPGFALGQGDAKRGDDLFHKNCAACHGNAGKGDGAAAMALNPKPRDLSDKAYVGGLNDEYLHDVIQKGGVAMKKSPLMPALGGALKDEDIADVIAYVRTLAQ
jgi:mono/diheme cytochrome c family protein